MNNTLQDTIEREMILNAPIGRVYHALADAKGICSWFMTAIEGKYEAGEDVVFMFQGSTAVFRVSAHIVAMDPQHYCAYRWVPGSDTIEGDLSKVATTLVEFFLTETEGGTKLRMVESGFTSLSPDYYEQAFKDNNGGWDEELPKLKAFVEQA
ncbi:MAG: SRPBCC family protein [Fimbriimonadaceae bacterium]|nr:SRPBCC family protein [Fimbriimonadaceae bacterium]